MHEMSYVVTIVNRALETAEERGASRVRGLTVSIGEMSDVLPEYFEKYFYTAAKETLLEGAELTIRQEPVKVQCAGCGQSYHPDRENHYICPGCGKSEGKVVAGRGIILEQIELETE